MRLLKFEPMELCITGGKVEYFVRVNNQTSEKRKYPVDCYDDEPLFKKPRLESIVLMRINVESDNNLNASDFESAPLNNVEAESDIYNSDSEYSDSDAFPHFWENSSFEMYSPQYFDQSAVPLLDSGSSEISMWESEESATEFQNRLFQSTPNDLVDIVSLSSYQSSEMPTPFEWNYQYNDDIISISSSSSEDQFHFRSIQNEGTC